MIELYIDNNKLDISQEISINFTYNSVDTQEPTAVHNSFSKTVTIPGTPNNDKIFGSIYRLDSYISLNYPNLFTGVNFDPHKRTPFVILQNGSIIESGYAVLDSINITSEREHQYNLTLYGGLGEFFFNLMYDDEGNEKNLADLYWKWIPMKSYTSLDNESDPMTPNEEDTKSVYRLNAANVAYAYHRFDPNDTTAFTSKTFILDDVIFVPMYYGYNNDFTSNKFLVNRQSVSSLPATFQTIWDKTFPSSFTDGEDTYSTYVKNVEDSYGVIELPRDIDPAEAHNFRVTNMPMAIKLSKLMGRISDSVNNGGYTVVWDDYIKNSYWWKYGFILVDTPEYITEESSNQTIGDVTFEDTNLTEDPGLTRVSTHDNWNYEPTVENIQTISTSISVTGSTNPVFKFTPYVTGTLLMHTSTGIGIVSSLNSTINGNNYIKSSNALCWLVQFYDDTTLIKSELCMASFSNTDDHFGSDYSINGTLTEPSSLSGWGSKVITYVNNRFGTSLTISDIYFKDSQPLIHMGSTTSGNYGKEVSFRSNALPYDLPVPDTINELTIKITHFDLNYFLVYDGSNYSDYVYGKTSSDLEAVYDLVANTLGSGYQYRLFFTMNLGVKSNESGLSGSFYNFPGWVTTSSSGPVTSTSYHCGQTFDSSYEGYIYDDYGNIAFIDIYKSTLMNNTKSPYKYLIDFAKMLNLRFIYDKTQKKITILPNKKYYLDQTVDLKNEVDYSRGIKLIHLFNKNKFIKAKLETQDTWPNTIYKKISKYDFGEYTKDTGIMFNKDSTNLFDSLIYSNSIMYQQSSIYHNIYNFLPAPIAQNMVSWTLFNIDGDDIKSATQSFPAFNQTNITDEVPKIGSFDKDNKTVKVDTTFVFFNGLVKNFNIVQDGDDYILAPKIMLTDNAPIQTELAGAPCYYWGYKSTGDSTGYGEVYDNCAVSWYMPYFSRNLFNSYISSIHRWSISSSLLASWDTVKPVNNLYNEQGMEFVTYSNATYTHTMSTVPTNFAMLESYSNTNSSYIIPKFWDRYINDIYDINAKEVELYAIINEDPNTAMRKFYSFDGSLWILTKIEDHKINSFGDRFSKCTLHKIKDKNNYLNYN